MCCSAIALAAPHHETIRLGQTGVILAAMVVADDVLGRRRSPWRGVLTGVATAVKLTPGLFVVADLCRGERRKAAAASATVAGLMLLGAIVMPQATLAYATSIIEVGGDAAAAHMSNQSVWAATTRILGTEAQAASIVALAVVAAVVALALLIARRHDDPKVALCMVAAATLVVSPISWTHHWVWVLPLAVLAARGVLSGATRWVGLALALWVIAAPYRLFQAPGKVDYPLGEALVGTVSAALVLALAATCAHGSTRVRR